MGVLQSLRAVSEGQLGIMWPETKRQTPSALPPRDIFERVIHLSLAPKRMKFFFKRYLDYEKQHGSEKDVQAVKAKALEYVEAKSSMMDD